MIQLNFTAEDIKQIHYYRFHHPHPRVQRKMEALYLKSQKYPHKEIAKLIRVTEPTVLSYFRDYQAGGIAQLQVLTFNRPQSEMKQYQTSISDYFREHPPKNLAHAAATITELTGIVRSREQVRQFQINGDELSESRSFTSESRSRCPRRIPKKKLAPRLEEAQAGERAVFFVDAAHFVLGAYLGFLWCFERLFVKSGAGRQRLGARQLC